MMVELGVDTLTKLRLLLEASDYGEGEAAIVATSALCTVGPGLARLVVTLEAALKSTQSLPLLMKGWDKSSRDAAYDNIRAALDAVEKLEL